VTWVAAQATTWAAIAAVAAAVLIAAAAPWAAHAALIACAAAAPQLEVELGIAFLPKTLQAPVAVFVFADCVLVGPFSHQQKLESVRVPIPSGANVLTVPPQFEACAHRMRIPVPGAWSLASQLQAVPLW